MRGGSCVIFQADLKGIVILNMCSSMPFLREIKPFKALLTLSDICAVQIDRRFPNCGSQPNGWALKGTDQVPGCGSDWWWVSYLIYVLGFAAPKGLKTAGLGQTASSISLLTFHKSGSITWDRQ